MNNNQLKELIAEVANKQDKASFIHVFDYFSPRIMGYLVNSGSQKEIAEKLTQEVLSTVWLKAIQFDQKKGNVSTWIFTIARNKRIDHLRKKENPAYNTLDLIDTLYSEENLQNQDLELKIKELWSKLNEKDRELIKMNFFEGKSHKIISKSLEIPLGTVKSRIRNILTKMQKS